MSRDAFVDPGKRFLGSSRPPRIRFIIGIEGHMIQPFVWIRVSKRPTVVGALYHMNKLVGRMLIDIRLHQSTVIAGPVSIPAIPKRVSDVIALIHDCPQVVCSRHERQAFRVANTTRNEFPVSPVEVVTIDRASRSEE